MSKDPHQFTRRRLHSAIAVIAAAALTAALPVPAEPGDPFDYRNGAWTQAWVETPASSDSQRTFTLPTFHSEAVPGTGAVNVSPAQTSRLVQPAVSKSR